MNQKEKRLVVVSVAVVIVIAVACVVIYFLTRGNGNEFVSPPIDTNKLGQITNSSLIMQDIKIGTGQTAEAGKEVTVHYVGTFVNGQKFDSSRDRGEPFTFTLGAGQVIKGWDQGVAGMKVGGIRKLTIPPDLGYGPNDYGPIPGGSTLLFEVELLDVK